MTEERNARDHKEMNDFIDILATRLNEQRDRIEDLEEKLAALEFQARPENAKRLIVRTIRENR